MLEASGVRRKRRDAAENRERILDHAEKLFETDGLEIGFHRIANDLHIGVGTVYRHFPDRDALFLALYERYHQIIEELGEKLMTHREGMPRVLAFIDGTIAFSEHRPVSRRVSARVQQTQPERARASRWQHEVFAAVRRAQQDGDLRDDVEATDIAILAGMLADLTTIAEPRRSILLPRMRALAEDALRPVGQTRPALDATALSLEDITALAHQTD